MRLFSNILYVVGHQDGLPGLKRAVSLAKRENATLTLVSVIETHVNPVGSSRFYTELNEAFDALRAERLKALKTLENTIPAAIETHCEVMDGSSYLELIKRVQLYSHDLVVANVAEAGLSGNRLFVSEEMQLLRKCPCPVLLIKNDQAGPFKRVMATLDFEYYDPTDDSSVTVSLNDEVLETAVTIASEDKGRLDVINVYEVPGEGAITAGWIRMNTDNYADYSNSCQANSKRRVDAQIDRTKSRIGDEAFSGADLRTHIVKGRARSAIPEMAEKFDTDLVVMGTVGRVGASGLLIGNTAETILNNINCSVLALKPAGFETPVKLD